MGRDHIFQPEMTPNPLTADTFSLLGFKQGEPEANIEAESTSFGVKDEIEAMRKEVQEWRLETRQWREESRLWRKRMMQAVVSGKRLANLEKFTTSIYATQREYGVRLEQMRVDIKKRLLGL